MGPLISDTNQGNAIPAGLIPVFVADLFERFAYYAMMGILAPLIMDYLGWSFEEWGTLYAFFPMAVMFLPVVGGAMGDKVGHSRSMLVGSILLATGYSLLIVPLMEPGEAEGPMAILGLAIVAGGIGFYRASTLAIVLNLHDSDDCRFSAYSSFLIMYAVSNLAALAASSFNGVFVEMGGELGFDRTHYPLVLGLCVTASIVTIILVSINARTLSGAGLKIREMSRNRISPPDHGTTDFRKAALPVVLTLLFFYTIPFGGYYGLLYSARPFLDPGDVDMNALTDINPAMIMVLVPVLAVLVAIFRGRGHPVNPLLIAGAGAAVSTIGMAILGVGISEGQSISDIPDWLNAHAWEGWFYTSIVVFSLGEVLTGATLMYVLARIAPPRFTGLIMAAYLGVAGLGHLISQKILALGFSNVSATVIFAIVGGVCAGMFFLVGFKMRRAPAA